jgi:hypothetical protein
VDEQRSEIAASAAAHSSGCRSTASYTANVHPETRADLGGHQLSTVSTAPVNTTERQISRTFANVSLAPTWGRPWQDAQSRGPQRVVGALDPVIELVVIELFAEGDDK